MPKRGRSMSRRRPSVCRGRSRSSSVLSSMSGSSRYGASVGGRLPRPQHLSQGAQLKMTKKVSTTSLIQLLPATGISIAGVTTSATLGIYFTGEGMFVYNPAIGPGTSVSFTYNNFNNYVGCFDQYRVRRVNVTGFYSNNNSNTSSVATSIPTFYTCIDYDGGANPPTSASAVLSYDNSAISQATATGKPAFSRTWVPRVINNLTGNLVVSNQYGLMPESSWIDAASANCPHFGMFIFYENGGASQATTIGALTLIGTLEVEFKGAR